MDTSKRGYLGSKDNTSKIKTQRVLEGYEPLGVVHDKLNKYGNYDSVTEYHWNGTISYEYGRMNRPNYSKDLRFEAEYAENGELLLYGDSDKVTARAVYHKDYPRKQTLFVIRDTKGKVVVRNYFNKKGVMIKKVFSTYYNDSKKDDSVKTLHYENGELVDYEVNYKD